jgi:glycosyltransferase involved in cell wall biosynthesis
MKLACVIHRFGADIAGGSESHCLAVAERLATRHSVTVLTSCAKNHITWQNDYPAGVSHVGPIEVHRFPVARTRSLHRFAEISEVVFSGTASEAEQEEWFRENGPEAPELLEFLRRHGTEYDRVLFWSFRYYQTFFGLPIVADRAVLVPTAEEDPLIRASILRRFFTLPAGYVFLTPEEETLVALHAARPLAPSCVIGVGFEPLPRGVPAPLDGLPVTRPFVLYLGRVDPNKGCEALLRYFVKYSENTNPRASLVMAGPANMPIPEHPAIKALGFVDESAKEALLSNASVLVVPSQYESLSIVLLDAWNHGVPGLVNARCNVLKGHAVRSNGALYYQNFDEFARCLGYLLEHADVAAELGRQGHAYVERDYRWPHVIDKLDRFLTALPPTATRSLPR